MKTHINKVSAALLSLSTPQVSSAPVTSKMMIHIPQSLSKEGGYDHREALFGFPRYGSSIAQNVYYVDSKLCTPDIRKGQGFPKPEGYPKPPFIMMVDRGDCTFVTKVRNAQKNGAAAVLIADTTCLCADEECTPTNNEQCEQQEPTMADDGSGSDISIPSFLLYKNDADLIKNEVIANRPVQVEMAWTLPSPDDRVEYELWTVPTDYLSREFLRSFKDVAVSLGDNAYFTPHMYIYDGKNAGCVGGDLQCANLCTNYGRYCATDPDNDMTQGISGADVVTESLRRLCIWSHYGEEDGIGTKWWDYVENFYNNCHTMTKFTDDACINNAMRRANIEEDYIRNCMKTSGGVEADSPNAILDKEIRGRSEKGIFILPTATVNRVPIRGALTSTNIFDAICSGYAPGTMPDICQQCVGCSNVRACVNNGGICSGGSISGGGSGSASSSTAGRAQVPKGKVSTPTFVLSLMFVSAAFAALGFWYYKRSQEEMRDHVRGILADYMPLEDQDDGGATGQSQMMSGVANFVQQVSTGGYAAPPENPHA